MKNLFLILFLFLSSFVYSQNSSMVNLSNDYTTYYVVVADTGSDYNELRSEMIWLSKNTHLLIDTLGRGYDPEQDLICLPKDDSDEVYAGTYFPRRFEAESLSLEYLSFFQDSKHPKTITIIAGLYKYESKADSVLNVVQRYNENSYKTKSTVYTGCVH